MRYRTDTWVKLAARGRFTMETKARIAQKDYYKISAPKIDRSLMSSPLSVGNSIAATLNLSILTDDQITSDMPITIMGRLTNGKQTSEWKEFGTFYIDQRNTSFEGLLTVTCYDSMLKANQAYLGSGDTSASWPKTQKAVVEEIAYRLGVGIDPRTKINTGTDYIVPYPENKTMLDVLSGIAACHGGNWIITEENLLRLVPLITAPDDTFHVIDQDYETIKTGDGSTLVYKQQTIFNQQLPGLTGSAPSSEIPVTHHITDELGQPIVTPEGYYLVWAADGSANAVDGLINVPVVCGQLTTGTQITVAGVSLAGEGQTYTAGDTSGNSGYCLTITSCPYATQQICNDLYTAYNGLVYFPYTATKCIYDPATELGDQVKIGDKVCSVMFSSTLTYDLNFRSDINAPNSEELSEEFPYLSEIKALKQSAENLNGSIQRTAAELTETVEAASADVTTLGQTIAAEVSRASGVEQELSTRIGAEKTRAEAAEAALSASIQQSVSGIPTNTGTRLSALETAVSGHTTSLSQISTALAACQTAAGAATTAAEENAEAIEEMEETVGDHTETLTDYGTRIEALETAVAAHTETIGTISTTLSSIEEALIDIYNRLSALEDTGSDDPETT